MPESRLDIVARMKDEATPDLKRLQETIGRMGKSALGFGAGLLGLSLGFGLIKEGVIGMNANLERSTMQFRTLMGDADAAKEHVQGLFKFAAETPFETAPIIEASRHLLNLGGSALSTEGTLRLVGDAAAGTSQAINEVAFWVGRAYSSIKAGRPFGEASMRLQEMGVLSAESRNKLDDLTESGAKTDVVWKVLTDDMKRFEGAMKLQASSWDGLVSTIKDNVMIGLAEAFEPAFAGLEQLAGGIADFVQTDQFKGWVADTALEVGNLIDNVQDFGDDLGQAMANAVPYVDAVAGALNEIKATIIWLKEISGSMPDEGYHANVQNPFVISNDVVQKHIKATRFAREEIKKSKPDIDAAEAALRQLGNTMGKTGETSKKTAEDIREAASRILASSSEVASYLTSIHPAALQAAEGVSTLKLQIIGLQDQQAAFQESIKASQSVLQGLQSQIGRLSEALSAAKQRLADLSTPRLKGMGEMDSQIAAVERQLKRLKLVDMKIPSLDEIKEQFKDLVRVTQQEGVTITQYGITDEEAQAKQDEQRAKALEEIMAQYPEMTQAMKDYLATLPNTEEGLQEILETLQLAKDLKFQEQLKKIADEANGVQEELSFEDAIAQIQATKAEIGNLEGQLAAARQAAEDQTAAIAAMQAASEEMTKAIQQMQDDLQIQEKRQDLVNDALKTAYQWFIDDRQKMMELGGEAVTQAGIVDEMTRELLTAITQYAEGEAAAARLAIQAALDEYNKARAQMAGGLLGGAGSSASQPPAVQSAQASSNNTSNAYSYNQPQTVLVQDRAAAAMIIESNRNQRIRRLAEAF